MTRLLKSFQWIQKISFNSYKTGGKVRMLTNQAAAWLSDSERMAFKGRSHYKRVEWKKVSSKQNNFNSTDILEPVVYSQDSVSKFNILSLHLTTEVDWSPELILLSGLSQMICGWSQRFRNSAFIYIHRRSMSVNWSMCRTIINKYGSFSVHREVLFCYHWSLNTMFQLPLVFNNEITRYEYVPKRNYISVHCQQQWQTATRLGLLIMIVLLLYLRVMSGCTTGLSVCSHRHLISELQGRSQSIAPFHSASLFLFSIFFSAAAASPDSVTCPPVWLVTNKVCLLFSCAEHRWQAH